MLAKFHYPSKPLFWETTDLFSVSVDLPVLNIPINQSQDCGPVFSTCSTPENGWMVFWEVRIAKGSGSPLPSSQAVPWNSAVDELPPGPTLLLDVALCFYNTSASCSFIFYPLPMQQQVLLPETRINILPSSVASTCFHFFIIIPKPLKTQPKVYTANT